MQLAGFSVRNYRSITNAYRLPIKQSTILIGPNNEGKSNILRALVTCLKVLQSLGGIRIQSGRLLRSSHVDSYVWDNDFPISLQQSHPNGESIFDIQFRLTAAEISDFYNEVESTLNGNLPIRLTLGGKSPGFRVMKKGPGGPALSKKAERIANFVSKRININYIPAVRTAEAAQQVVRDMVDTALRAVEADQAYQEALAAVAKLQEPLLATISDGIKDTLKVFLPNVQSVRVEIPQDARVRALRRCDIVVDDGTPTELSRKGDGVQSLAALSLLRQSAESRGQAEQMILAIEEPESHLHPNAIHQLKKVLGDIAATNQIIMTTHCPLFVERAQISSNIIVHGNKATPASNVADIRRVLGVRAADNLQHAELILIVEGEEDRVALRALLAHCSPTLKASLSSGTLGVESLQGASNLSYKLSTLREALCNTHSFLDWDSAGLQSAKKAEQDGLLTPADINYSICQGQQEAEFEDLLDTSLYASMLQNNYGVSLQSPKFKGNRKWSDRLQETFKHQGKLWNDATEMKVKAAVAELVVANPTTAINSFKKSILDALVAALEQKLNAISLSKKTS